MEMKAGMINPLKFKKKPLKNFKGFDVSVGVFMTILLETSGD
jgi:hypothetical protein